VKRKEEAAKHKREHRSDAKSEVAAHERQERWCEEIAEIV